MGGLGFLLGGAMSGYGQGMAEVGRSAEEERRTIALENLRSQNTSKRTEEQYNFMDRNAERQTERETGKAMEVNKQKHGFDIEIMGAEGSQKEKQMRLQSTLDREETAASLKLQQELGTGKVHQVIEGGDGFYHVVYSDGRKENSGIKITPSKMAGGLGSSVLDQLSNNGGEEDNAPAPKPSPARTREKPAAEAAPDRPKAKTYSQSDAATTAKKYGMSIDEVHRRMREAGYKLTN